MDSPLVAFSISNTNINACLDIDQVIPHNIQHKIYPAVLIGRLATHSDYERQGHAKLAIDLIKVWFISENKTGCRFITVDSRIESVGFYKRCGFEEFPEESTNKDTIF